MAILRGTETAGCLTGSFDDPSDRMARNSSSYLQARARWAKACLSNSAARFSSETNRSERAASASSARYSAFLRSRSAFVRRNTVLRCDLSQRSDGSLVVYPRERPKRERQHGKDGESGRKFAKPACAHTRSGGRGFGLRHRSPDVSRKAAPRGTASLPSATPSIRKAAGIPRGEWAAAPATKISRCQCRRVA